MASGPNLKMISHDEIKTSLLKIRELLGIAQKDDSWRFAMDEMSSETNDLYCEAMYELEKLTERISYD